MLLKYSWILFVLNFFRAETANILFLATLPSPSHHFWNIAIADSLAARGHNVTYFSPNEDRNPAKNVHYIVVEKLYDGFYKEFVKQIFQGEPLTPYQTPISLLDACVLFCEHIVKTNGFRQLLGYPDNFKFDLIIYDFTTGPCSMPFLHKFKYPPLVSVTAYGRPPYSTQLTGGNDYYSYIPHNAFTYRSDLTFWQRIYNFAVYIEEYLVRQYKHIPQVDKIGAEYFGFEFPSTSDLEQHTKIALVNTNPIFDFPAPLPENVIPVAGLHIKEAKPLPKDLEEFFDSSKNGVVMFSLGSSMQSKYMPIEQQRIFVDVFAQIPQYDFIWKFENNVTAVELPKNVRIRAWLPQSDMLAHPKLKAFITHGGLLSTQEAIWRGVPLIGLPLGFDQHTNTQMATQKGMAETVDFRSLNRKELLEKLLQILENPRYTENAKKMSALFRDQKEPPLERAIWWIEWVLRNPDCDYLKSPVLRLGYIVGNSIDVIAFVTIVLAAVIFLQWKLLSLIIIKLFYITKYQDDKKKKSN